jgi:hypothetical protein
MAFSNTSRRSARRTAANSQSPRCLALYDGQRCVGFILAHGTAGYEAIAHDEVSQVLFPTQQEAAAALSQLPCSCGSPTRSSP